MIILRKNFSKSSDVISVDVPGRYDIKFEEIFRKKYGLNPVQNNNKLKIKPKTK